MAKFFHKCRAPNTCGVGIISMFRKNTVVGGNEIPSSSVNEGGCGWLMCGFITDTAAANDGVASTAHKEAYEELKKKYKMMDQYPVRTNDNTDNKFFFVIYDTKSTKGPVSRAEHNSQFNWPL